MRVKLLILSALVAFICLLSISVDAQYMTKDLVLLKIGYIPMSNVTFDDEEVGSVISSVPITGDIESMGYAIQGEYNLIWGNFWFGFGLEYQRLSVDRITTSQGDTKEFHNDFLIPMVSAKLAATGGLYVGAGISGKWLISTEKFRTEPFPTTLGYTENEFDKAIDLWANAILGYHLPIGEGVFFDLEGRFGFNLTNNQFEEKEQDYYQTSSVPTTSTIKYSPKTAYDIAFYVGVGTRARGSEY
ncbi:MAG: hypothetical protein SVZ03_07125 [Spirochaetota bacterium]|nr:hypothetical protein [Spirochaetota bacterium]